jgi:hypothetical protein
VLASPLFSRESVPRAYDKIVMELNNRVAFINNRWDEVVAVEIRQLTLFCDFEPRAMADLRLSVPLRRGHSYGQRSIVPGFVEAAIPDGLKRVSGDYGIVIRQVKRRKGPSR